MFSPETKTKAAGVAAFVASGLAIGVLQGVDLSGLPSWGAAIAGAAITSAITVLIAYQTKHKPDAISESALEAARRKLGFDRRPSV